MNAQTQHRFLVVGTAIAETVRHLENGRERRGLGGVGATMALALAQAGNRVTLLTTVGPGPAGQEAMALLEEAPFTPRVVRKRGQAGHARINTLRGEQAGARGRWPRVTGVLEAARELAGEHDMLLTECNTPPAEMNALLELFREKTTLVNGTTTRRCIQLLAVRETRKSAVTLNRAEAGNLLRAAQTEGYPELRLRLNAERLLVTLGEEGWALHSQEEHRVSFPVPTPPGTDFIGCGDYASAGLAHAIAHGEEPGWNINEFVRRKLKINTI